MASSRYACVTCQRVTRQAPRCRPDQIPRSPVKIPRKLRYCVPPAPAPHPLPSPPSLNANAAPIQSLFAAPLGHLPPASCSFGPGPPPARDKTSQAPQPLPAIQCKPTLLASGNASTTCCPAYGAGGTPSSIGAPIHVAFPLFPARASKRKLPPRPPGQRPIRHERAPHPLADHGPG